MNHSRLQLVVISALVAMLFAGCVEETGSLYDPSHSLGRAPVISSMTSTLRADSAIAGYDTLTITGANFAPIAQDNWVFFNSGQRAPFQATETELRVRPTLNFGDSVDIRIGTRLSDSLSLGPVYYKVGRAVAEFSGLADSTAHAMATDAAGNLYVSIGKNGVDAGVFRATPDGGRSPYAPASAGISNWTGLKMGPGGYLYAVRGVRAIYRANPGGGALSIWTQITSPAGVLISDIDFDAVGNLWCVGNNKSIYCVRPARTVKATPDTANIRSVRVFNGYLYYSAAVNGLNKIWRAQILVDSLATPEVYFDFDAAYGSLGYVPEAITFSSDGYLFIATSRPEGVVIVSPSMTTAAPYFEYTALVNPAMKWLAWGSENSLYGSSGNGLLLRFHTRQTSAPYYGQ